MLNHARTLLMNVNGGDFIDYPGEELIPRYSEIQLPSFIETVRAQLFGTNPDRYMLNYRVRQLLAVIHASPLSQHLLSFDYRTTYTFDGYDWPDSIFVPEVTKLAGDEEDTLTIIGKPTMPDVTGKCYILFDIEALTTTTIAVSRMTAPFSKVVLNFAVSSGLSEPIPLPGSGYSFFISTNNQNQHWRIKTINKPQFDMSRLVESLSKIGEPVINSLFGVEQVEPYMTFRNLWYRKKELPLRLGAIVCALIYRTEERRVGNG